MRLIDADALLELVWRSSRCAIQDAIQNAPTVDAEPTEEQVKEYCRKRCLVVIDSGLFNEMKAWME